MLRSRRPGPISIGFRATSPSWMRISPIRYADSVSTPHRRKKCSSAPEDSPTPPRWHATPRALPIYVAVGSKDPVNGGLTLLWALVDRYRTAGLTDVTVRVYDDGRHEILNEINRTEVIDDLLQWLQRVSELPMARTNA